MNINDHLKIETLKAGGPGSGRRPYDSSMSTHDVARNFGYVMRKGLSGKYEQGANVLRVRGGNWAHSVGTSMTRAKEGNGAESLYRHLEKVHGS
jgi:hypothetical protein